jgi:hypothetical protein
VGLEDAHGRAAIIKRKKSAAPYKDPMAGEKLEMITKIRAQRAALEIEKKEAIRRARYSCLFHYEKKDHVLDISMLYLAFAKENRMKNPYGLEFISSLVFLLLF